MLSLSVLNVRHFMGTLLKSELFDEWSANKVNILTFTNFDINCKVNTQFYSADEQELITDTYIKWEEIKSIVVSIIKGNKQPTSMKIVLSYPLTNLTEVDISNLSGVYLNVHFENSKITLTTGISQNTFSIDKSLETYWEEYCNNFLVNNGIEVYKE